MIRFALHALISTFALPNAAAALSDSPAEPEETVPSVEIRIGDHSFRCTPLQCDSERRSKVFAGFDGVLRTLPESEVHGVVDAGETPLRALPPAVLVSGLEHGDRYVRDHSQQLLSRQGEVALEALRGALTSGSGEVRWRSLMILSQRSDRRSKPHIRQNLKHRDDKVRKYALLAYSRLQPDDLLERCQTVLRFDRSDRVQHQAILLLGQFGGVEVVDSLIRHLDDSESRGVRLALFTALRRLTGLDLGRRQGDWQAWWTNHREEVLADADLL